jgi:phage/plasmid primase-like uncharacterized protein
MNNDLFRHNRNHLNRERAALIKARVSVADAIAALGLAHEMGDECPNCGGFQLRANDRGDGAWCESCRSNFDCIGLVQVRRRLGFDAACDWIDAEIINRPQADDRQGDML